MVPLPHNAQELAKNVRKAIDNNPEMFFMGSWLEVPRGDGERTSWGNLLANEEPQCGTTMCVAGWAAHLAGYDIRRGEDTYKPDGEDWDVENTARIILGLSEYEANSLFYLNDFCARRYLDIMADEGHYPDRAQIKAIWNEYECEQPISPAALTRPVEPSTFIDETF